MVTAGLAQALLIGIIAFVVVGIAAVLIVRGIALGVHGIEWLVKLPFRLLRERFR